MADTSYIISGGFFDSVDSDRLYSADDMNMPYKDLVNDGIYKESDGTTPGFAVTVSGSMNVLVAPGRALIGGKWGANKEIQTIEIAGNTGGTARIDSIVLQCDRNLDVRAVQLVYRQGGGSAPELLTSDGITEFRLANIRVAASASAISSGDITDTRGGTECPWVTSVFDPPDADYILTEYRTDLAGENRTVKAAIDSLQNAAQTGQPAVANQAADMRDTSLVYLYEGSEEGYDAGYLYHYSAVSDQWIRGAQYGASTVDTALSDSSTNAVQNRVVKAAVDQLTDDVAELNERLLATETELKSTLDDIADNHNVMDYGDSTLTTGLSVNISTGEVTSGSANVKDIIFPVTAGTTYTMLLPAVNRGGMVCNSEKQFSVGNEYTRIAANTSYSNMAIFTVPDGNEYVLFHFYTGADFSGSVTDFKLYEGQYAETQKNITLKDDAIPLASVTSKKQGLSPIAYLFEDIYKLQNQNLTWNTGVSILPDGSVGSAGVATDNASDNVDVSAYDMVYIKASAGYTRLLYAFYDSNSNFVLGKNSISTGYENFAEYVKVPITAKYLKVAQSTSAGNLAGALSFVTGIYDKPWKNKKWVCIGDSLTQVNSTSTKRYYEYVQDVTGIQVANFGVGGTGYANPNGTAGNFVDRMANVPTDADVYTIFGSFNDVDYGRTNNIEIGTASDSGTTTMCGYFNAAIDALLARVSLANVGVVAPCPWQYCYPAGTGENSTYGKAYVDALEEVCKRRSIPFLNLFNFSGMRPWVSDFRTLVYTDDPAGGVHPNAIGHEILSTKFKQFLEYLLI